MRISLVLFFCLFVAPCWSQSHSVAVAKAQTAGCGSPIVTGNGNKFTITCQGIPDALRSQIVDLLNKIAKDQANADEMMNKLNSCVEGVQQVREQQQPWRLTDDQKMKLKAALNGTKAEAAIYALSADNNSTLLAGDLLEILQSKPVGWDFGNTDIHYYPNVFPPPDLIGVVILVSDRYRPGIQPMFPAALTLTQTLIDTGMRARLFTANDQELLHMTMTSFKETDLGSLIVIGIGSKPPTTPDP